MNPVYIAAGIVSVVGLCCALALVAFERADIFPRSLAPNHSDWPYDEIDYLWWDEGIYWAAR